MYTEEAEIRQKAKEIILKITGTDVGSDFGQPFTGAFATVFKRNNSGERLVAAYICSLFLSVITQGLPSKTLHTFVHNIREHCPRITFSCELYPKLNENIEEEALCNMLLLNNEGRVCRCKCQRKDINEAFDFYTNM